MEFAIDDAPSVRWTTSRWERPLTPSGRLFPYRKSRDTSPTRLGSPREGDHEPFLTSVHMEDKAASHSGLPPTTAPPSSTYTVQYIGLAKGELGVLSKKEVMRAGRC